MDISLGQFQTFAQRGAKWRAKQAEILDHKKICPREAAPGISYYSIVYKNKSDSVNNIVAYFCKLKLQSSVFTYKSSILVGPIILSCENYIMLISMFVVKFVFME